MLACRLCGSGDSVRSVEGALRLLIVKYVGIPIERTDVLPKTVCEECAFRVEGFHEFVERCVHFQAELIAVSSFSDSIKLELEPDQQDQQDERPPADPDNEQDQVKQEYLKEDEDDELSNGYEDDPLDYDYEDESAEKPAAAKSRLRSKKSRNSETMKSGKRRGDCNVKSFIVFQCYVCQRDLENWYRLKGHIVGVHQQTPKVKCACGCELKSKTAIYRHVAGHNDPTSYSCDQCSRVTKTLEALEAHKMRHVPKPERVYSCASCPKQFNSKENLKSHERVHIPLSERYNYPCNVCGNKFTTKSAVVGHIRAVHEKIKRFICDICGYSCSTGGELVQHRAIHSEDKLFECRICKKRFKTCSNLKAHIDIHAETSYPCGVCGRVLNSRRTLRKHFLVHEDVCKHVCTYCNKAFKRRQTLKVHLTTHTGDKPIQCPWCPDKFAFSSALRNHKMKVHFDKMSEIKEEHKEMIKME